jgi:ABC-type transporter Mla subunit MlaD
MARINTDRLKLELRRARTPALQYLFVAACAIFALTILLKNQYFDKPWQDKSTYYVQIDDVKGVVPGQQRVRMAGVDVGIITDSKVGENNKPVLQIKVDNKFGKFYKNARMNLRPLTPLQDIYLDVQDRGTPAAGRLKDGEMLTGGQARSAVDISRVLNTFDDDTRLHMRSLLTDLSKGLSNGGGDDLKRTFVQLAPFLQAAQRTSGAVAERRQNMKRLVHNIASLSTALGERDKQLTALVRDGSSTLTEIGRNQGPFDATLASIPGLLSTMRTSFASLRSAEDQLDPALRSLAPVSQQLEAGLQGLQKFTADARPALADLREPVRALEPLAQSLKPTASSLDSAVRRLRPQAPQFDRLTAELPPCFGRMSDFFNDTLSVFKFRGQYGALPRGEDFGDATSGPGVPSPGTDVGTKLPTVALKPAQLCTGDIPKLVSRSNP